MGNLMPRGILGGNGVQEIAIPGDKAYKWPPKSGNYFGGYFIMGGERFDAPQPESFLFGENTDLNFLGSQPKPFPYPPPQLTEPTRTLKSLINIRKDSVRLVRVEPTSNEDKEEDVKDKVPEEEDTGAAAVDAAVGASGDSEAVGAEEEKEEEASIPVPPPEKAPYNLEFVFDADVSCQITIHYFGVEELDDGNLTMKSSKVALTSPTYSYGKGVKQTFSQSAHLIQPEKFPEDKWHYDMEEPEIPILIHCTVNEEGDSRGHSHMTLVALEKGTEGYSAKVIKQKQVVDGMVYILQEFYGIENKEMDKSKVEDELDDNGSECVICMSDIRNTLILPCRHMCLCNGCADNLRYHASACPICRSPFRALLQIRAIRRKQPQTVRDTLAANQTSDEEDEVTVSQKGVPAGYEAISLVEALNGPYKVVPGSARGSMRVSNVSLRRQGSKGKKKHKDDKLKKEKEKSKRENEKKETKATRDAAQKEKEAGSDGNPTDPPIGNEGVGETLVEDIESQENGDQVELGAVVTSDAATKNIGVAASEGKNSLKVVDETGEADGDSLGDSPKKAEDGAEKTSGDNGVTEDEDSSWCDEEKQFLKPEEQDDSSSVKGDSL